MCLGLLACGVAGVVPVSAAARRSFKTPGYRWNHKLPKVAPVVPGRLLTLGDGEYPHVLVDAAGTGQIAYTTAPNGAPSVLHDCVLLRGQTGCAANSGLVPAEAGDPRYNIDDDGPTPLAIGNELLMLDHRYPNAETLPDGSAGYPTFLWTSEDGGKNFTGPGIVGNLGVSGNAIVFGGSQPRLGWISDTMSGGTFFQSTPPGAYTSQRLNLGDQGPDEAYDGRLALDGSNPVAEFQDLSNHIYIREYKGTGDINSSSSWSVAVINGQGYSRLVSGRSGVWLLYQKTFSGPLFVQHIVHGLRLGRFLAGHAQYRLPARLLRDHRGRRRPAYGRMVHRPRVASTSGARPTGATGRLPRSSRAISTIPATCRSAPPVTAAASRHFRYLSPEAQRGPRSTWPHSARSPRPA